MVAVIALLVSLIPLLVSWLLFPCWPGGSYSLILLHCSQETMPRKHETLSKYSPKPQKSIKMDKNEAQAKKLAPRIGKGAKKAQT